MVMNRGNLVAAALLGAAIAIASSVQAQPRQGLSPEDLVLQLERDKKPGGSRGIQACAITPQSLTEDEASEQVWSLQPLFLWQLQGTPVASIQLYALDEAEPFWSREPEPGATHLAYDGEPLEPGQTYEWETTVVNALVGQSDFSTFTVMAADKRQQIASDLERLEARLKAADASPEAIALERASYFAARALWSDALGELYSVDDPSPELQAARAQLETIDFCDIN